MIWMQVIKTGSTGGRRATRGNAWHRVVAVTTLGINTNMIM
jgi:hypothetical protein